MARSERITCDVCGAEKKGRGDRWFTLASDGTFLRLSADDLNAIEHGTAFDICGQSCAIKKISELIGGAR